MATANLDDFRGYANGWTPPDRRPIYAWAKEHLTLPPSYAIQGKFDVSVTRPLIAVFDDIQNPLVNRIRFRKPPRFGGSMVSDIAIPWIICNDPGPVMSNWQSDEDAKGHMKQKAWALWKSCKPFKALLPPDKNDRTTTEIYFGPFFLLCQGANLNNLQGVGVRWLFNDETWLPVWQDLYQHAVYRTRDYERSGAYKITDVSQAGNAGDVEDRNWRTGQQAIWNYRNSAGGLTPLTFGGKHEDGRRWGLIWNQDAKRADGSWHKARAIETACYVCRDTGHEYFDRPETIAEWNRGGEYVATRADAPANVRSYGVNGLLNRSFASLVEEKVEAMEQASRGDMSAMRDFKQKAECIPWEETHLTITINAERSGYAVSDYADGKKIPGEKTRCMTVDRQKGMKGDTPHRWVEVRAFTAAGDSRQLFFGRLDTKEAVRDFQKRYGVEDRKVWQDAAWEKDGVYRECAEYGWLACYGSNLKSWAHYTRIAGQADPVKMSLPYSPIQLTEVGQGAKAHYLYFSEDYMADILANLVAGRGVKFEKPDDCPPEYEEHLKAEHKVEKRPGVFSWEKIHATKANHGWDTSKMQIAFACLMKLLSLPKPPPQSSP